MTVSVSVNVAYIGFPAAVGRIAAYAKGVRLPDRPAADITSTPNDRSVKALAAAAFALSPIFAYAVTPADTNLVVDLDWPLAFSAYAAFIYFHDYPALS